MISVYIKSMNDITLKITKSKSKYEQCNFCLSKTNLYNIKGDRLAFELTVCKRCISKIADVVSIK